MLDRDVWWRSPFHLKAVIVTLQSDDDTAIRGVAWQTRGAWIVLKNAELLRPHADPLKIDGDVVIARSNVAFVQVP